MSDVQHAPVGLSEALVILPGGFFAGLLAASSANLGAGAMTGDDGYCAKCEGDGSYSELAPCTTFNRDCACNGERVLVDPCEVCGGSGECAR